jgi:hypothetical protein
MSTHKLLVDADGTKETQLRMKDTTHLAYTAEDYIAYKLQEAGFLVAKPKFDRDGTDLILLLSVKPGTKFGKVQCKGRSLRNSPQTNITIPCEYAREPFFLFVYVNYKFGEDLYLFFTEDIKKWEASNDQYVIYINKGDIDNGSMRDFLYHHDKTDRIADIIRRTTSELENEMFRVIRMGMDVIDKQKKATALAELIHGIVQLNKEEESTKKTMREAYKDLRYLAEEIMETVPSRVIDKIQKFKKDGSDEESVLLNLLKDNSIDLDKNMLWLVILSLYDSVESKF